MSNWIPIVLGCLLAISFAYAVFSPGQIFSNNQYQNIDFINATPSDLGFNLEYINPCGKNVVCVGLSTLLPQPNGRGGFTFNKVIQEFKWDGDSCKTAFLLSNKTRGQCITEYKSSIRSQYQDWLNQQKNESEGLKSYYPNSNPTKTLPFTAQDLTITAQDVS